MAAELAANHHGKGRVRITKVVRKGDRHELLQYNVRIHLEGPMTPAFVNGNNTIVIPTDTQKNTVYVVAKKNEFESPEEFSLLLARHFLDMYPELVTRVSIVVKQDLYRRVVCADSKGVQREHNHAFIKVGPHSDYARCEGVQGGSKGAHELKLWGGIKELSLLKTTQSSFFQFHKDQNTSLPEASDRLMGTALDAEWAFQASTITSPPRFAEIRAKVEEQLIGKFSGPADVGVHSASVQATGFNMGAAVLAAVPVIVEITLYLPNIHNIPFDLTRYGLPNVDHTGAIDILTPSDEPHGIIQATIRRPSAKL